MMGMRKKVALRRMMGMRKKVALRRMKGNAREKSQSIFFHPSSRSVDVNVQRKVSVMYFVLKIFHSFHAQLIYSLFDYILGLFGIRDVLINTDHTTEDHIEAAKVYIKT